MSQPATTFEIVRIDPVDPETLPDLHSRQRAECLIGWRSATTYASPQEAANLIDELVARDKKMTSKLPGLYVVVAAGRNPLRDTSCMPLLTRSGSRQALPF